jgi:hypothetical protein
MRQLIHLNLASGSSPPARASLADAVRVRSATAHWILLHATCATVWSATCILLPAAGLLRVLVTHGSGSAPPTTRYTLFPNDGGRFQLRVSADTSQWRTGMHLKVAGQQLKAGGALPSSTPTPELVITQVLQVTPGTSNSTTARGMVGTSPATMRVLFVIITMCGRPASITPAVSAGSRLDVSMCVEPLDRFKHRLARRFQDDVIWM